MDNKTLDDLFKSRGYKQVAENGSGTQRHYLKMIDNDGSEFSISAAVDLGTLKCFLSFLELKGFVALTSLPFDVNDEKDFDNREKSMVTYAALCIQADIYSIFKKWKDIDKPEQTNATTDNSTNDEEVKAPAKVKGKTIEERKKEFWDKIRTIAKPKGYSKEMCLEFRDYWTEHNEEGRKMRFEMQNIFDISKRLVTWEKNNGKFGPKKNYYQLKEEKQNQERETTIVSRKSDLF